MSHHSLYSRTVVFTLVLSLSGFVHTASFAQDISGGASSVNDISGGANVLLASADVEAKLGKGIFSSPPNRSHAAKQLEKKTVVRSAHPVRPQIQTTASNRPERDNPVRDKPVREKPVRDKPVREKPVRDKTEDTTAIADSTSKPLGEPAKRVPGAEDYHKQ